MTRAERDALHALIKRYGIQQSYRAAGGGTVRAAPETALAVLNALGVDTDGSIPSVAAREAERAAAHLVEPVVVAWGGRVDAVRAALKSAGAGNVDWQIDLENGDVVSADMPALLQVLPYGYHHLRARAGGRDVDTLVISAPRRCFREDDSRAWGVFAPLYAIRETDRQPIGTFDDLASLMRWTARQNGDVVGTLPVSAAFLRTPFEPSPYAPASRLFWNEIFLAQDDTDDGAASAAAASSLVDYQATAQVKRAQLEPLAARFFAQEGEQTPDFRDFLAHYPSADDYAAFRAAGEHFECGWTSWPDAARAGRLDADDWAESARRFHLYAQYMAHRQLAALARDAHSSNVRLYLDMPLGVHAESYDIWRNRELFVTGASTGAPPDPFFTKGQDWGFPPPHPVHMRTHHYRYWRAVLQTQLRYAGILRLDHVMALHRLYFVPRGFSAQQGAYVRYPAAELYAVLTLESVRHRTVVVGEDLGTVPAEVRRSMRSHGVKRMFVVQFEAGDDFDRPLAPVPPASVASLNTHDMPPFRAYWEGRDADLRKELDLIDRAGAAAAHATRQRVVAALSRTLGSDRPLSVESARDALIALLARAPADIVLINLEDVWLETEPQNVPGTSFERPNWRRRLRYTLKELFADARARELLVMVDRARKLDSSPEPH